MRVMSVLCGREEAALTKSGRSLLVKGNDAQSQGVEAEGMLTDEAAATFSELFGEGMDGKARPAEHHRHSVEHLAGVEDLDVANIPLNLDGDAGDWQERSVSLTTVPLHVRIYVALRETGPLLALQVCLLLW